MKLNLTALKAFMHINDDGSVDHKKTHDNFLAQITEYELRMRDDDGLAARGINAIFDRYKGAIMSTKTLVGFALQELQATPDNYQTLEVACKRYLASNTGTRGSLFGSSKGRGIWKWIDQPDDKFLEKGNAKA